MNENRINTVENSSVENNEKPVEKVEYNAETELFGSNEKKIMEKQDSSVENSGGSIDEIKDRTKDVDQQIKDLEMETTNKVEEVKNMSNGKNQEVVNEEAEKIKEQINEMLRKNTEGQEIQKINSDKINKIMELKGYSLKISELKDKISRTEISFGENLIPNKEVGLSNLNKIMAKIDSQEERPRKQNLKRELSEIINEVSASDNSTLYQSVQRMIKSTHDFKDMISSEDFNTLFPRAASSDHYNSELIKEKNKIEEQIESDPEINELKNQNLEASKLIEENSSYKIEALQDKLKEPEN